MQFISFAVLLQEVCMLVNPDKNMPAKWRWEARDSGRHVHLATLVDNIIDPEVANELRGLDVRELRVQDLRELARILGVSSSGNKDALTLRLTPLLQSINGMYHSHHNNPYTITLHPKLCPSHTRFRYWDRGIR